MGPCSNINDRRGIAFVTIVIYIFWTRTLSNSTVMMFIHLHAETALGYFSSRALYSNIDNQRDTASAPTATDTLATSVSCSHTMPLYTLGRVMVVIEASEQRTHSSSTDTIHSIYNVRYCRLDLRFRFAGPQQRFRSTCSS